MHYCVNVGFEVPEDASAADVRRAHAATVAARKQFRRFGLDSPLRSMSCYVSFREVPPEALPEIRRFASQFGLKVELNASARYSDSELRQARFLPMVVPYAPDYVTRGDEDVALNRWKVACRDCGRRDLRHVPTPYRVRASVDAGKSRIYSAGAGPLLVVREDVCKLLRDAVQDQIEVGPCALVNRAGSIVPGKHRWYWVRPCQSVGVDLEMRMKDACPACGAPRDWCPTKGRGSAAGPRVESFGPAGVEIARRPWWINPRDGSDTFHGDVVTSGRLLYWLKREGVAGLGRPERPLQSARKGEKAFTSDPAPWAESARQEAKPKRKPARRANLDDAAALAHAIALLRNARRQDPTHYARGATAAAIQAFSTKFKVAMPQAWQTVLEASDGFMIPDCAAIGGVACHFSSAAQLVREQASQLRRVQELGVEETDAMLYVGDTKFGDLFLLQMSRMCAAGDCPVVLMDHETGEVIRRWRSTGAMLECMLDAKAGKRRK